MSDTYVAPSNVVSRTGAGVVAGIAGGILLGVILWVLDALAPIGHLLNAGSATGQWTVLMVISTVSGALYGMLLGRFISGQVVSAVGVGIFFGGALWFLLELIAVPIDQDRSVGAVFRSLTTDNLHNLGAFVVFGWR
jgi:hypothetical protein